MIKMKEKFFFEELYPHIKIGLKIERVLYQKKTPFQRMQILETPSFGRVLTLDGVIQTTEKDEFIYHEMLVHPALFLHSAPERVLVIGAGDGGVLREVLKHKRVEEVTLVEIDREVIEVSEKFLSRICKDSFKHKKVRVRIEDGAKFVSRSQEKFDVVLVDSPDPVGPARVLFTRRFYTGIYNILDSSGIMVRQSGSTFLQKEELRDNHRVLSKIFRYTSVYLASIPTYIGGFFSFIITSKKINFQRIPEKTLIKRYKEENLKLKYYNPDLHTAAFKLPGYVKTLIGNKE